MGEPNDEPLPTTYFDPEGRSFVATYLPRSQLVRPYASRGRLTDLPTPCEGYVFTDPYGGDPTVEEAYRCQMAGSR